MTLRARRRAAGIAVLVLGALSLAPIALGAERWHPVASAGLLVDEPSTSEPPTTASTTTTTVSTTTTTAPTTTSTTVDVDTTTTTAAPATTTTTLAAPTTTSGPTTTTTRPTATTQTTTTTKPPTTTSTTGSTTTTTTPTVTTTADPTTTTGRGGGATPTTEPPKSTEITITADETADPAVEPEPLGTPGAEPVTVGRFSVSPHFGEPGTEVTLRLVFDNPIAGLDEVTAVFAGTAWGEPIVIDGPDVSVARTVPSVDPGLHAVTLAVGDRTLATAEFEVLEVAKAWVIPTWLWIVPPAGALLMWIVWIVAEHRRPVEAPNAVYQSESPWVSWRLLRLETRMCL